jgi:hypothetical protein
MRRAAGWMLVWPLFPPFGNGHNVNRQSPTLAGKFWMSLEPAGIFCLHPSSARRSPGPATFIISGSATNIGDALLPTQVFATLGTDGPLAISFVNLTNATSGSDDNHQRAGCVYRKSDSAISVAKPAKKQL